MMSSISNIAVAPAKVRPSKIGCKLADIFVSYSRQDKARVAPLVAALEAEGWSVWWDPEITPGEEFDALISRELEARPVAGRRLDARLGRFALGAGRSARRRRSRRARCRYASRAPSCRSISGPCIRPISTTGARIAQGAAFRRLCKALESKLGAPTKPRGTRRRRKDKRPEVSICVLPFANMSGDPEQEYFSDGITEDIITDLGKVSALSIVSRNMAFSFKGAKGGVGEIGRQTKAAYVLVGSVRKAGARVRITAQLVNAANEAQVWGERYDRDLNDIFALQDEISKAIVAALKLTLLPEEKRALEQRATTNVKAYKFYLMARQFSVMGNERHQEIIVRLCKRAVELDPTYAAPWATMAIAQWDMHRRSASRGRRQEAAHDAIALDPQLADAHAALGAAQQGEGRYEVGLKACEAALRLDPDSYEGNRIAGMCSMPLHRFDDAIRYFEKAAAVVETEFTAASFVVQMYGPRATPQERVRPRSAHWRAIEKVIAAEPDHGRALGYGAGLLATSAKRARQGMDRARYAGRPEQHHPALQFCLRAGAAARRTMPRWTCWRASSTRPQRACSLWFDNDTDLDPLRDNPRFVEIMRKAKARFARVS